MCNLYNKKEKIWILKKIIYLKTSDARRRANKKYSQSHYKSINYQAKISDYEQIKAYAESKNISISKLCKLCVAYCMENDIDITGND